MATVEPMAAPTRRGTELALLVLALFVGMSAYVIVSLRINGTIPVTLLRDTGGLALLTLALHLVVRRTAPYADPVLIPLVTTLNGVGLAMIYRLDLAANPDTGLAGRQLAWTGLSIVAAAAVLLILRDHRTLRRFTYLFLLAGIGLLMLPLIPGLGQEIYGARIWIRIGPMSFQPAELAKIALAIFFAGYLVTNRDTLALAGPRILGLHLPRPRDLGPLLLALGVSLVLLVAQRDLGTSLLFFGMFLAVLYIATERGSWILIGLVLFAGGAALAVWQFPHVYARFYGWRHALDNDVYYADYGSGQVVGGWFGMAGGGLFGAGWGEGFPQLVPMASSDFIIAALGEELGLVGLVALLILLMVLVERGMRTALGCRDGFGKLLAGGLSFAVAWQTFVVVGGVTGIIPITGLTTPFLAYGGSSLLANWIIVALLLRISDNARRPVPPPPDRPLVLDAPESETPAAGAPALDTSAPQGAR